MVAIVILMIGMRLFLRPRTFLNHLIIIKLNARMVCIVDTNMVSTMHSSRIIWDWSNKAVHPYIKPVLSSRRNIVIYCSNSLMAAANLRSYTTDKDKQGLIYNDYCYREVTQKRAADGGIFWRCILRSCRGRMKTDEDRTSVEYDGGHNHQPDLNDVLVREVKTRARKRAKLESTPVPTIYRQETAALAATPAAAVQMPTFQSISHTLYRERRSMFPPLPVTRDALILPQRFQETTTGERFLLKSSRHNRYLIFASDDNLRELCNAQVLSMDGTFSSVPRIYQQLFTISALFDNRLLPLVYVLMSRKTMSAYVRVFKALKRSCQNLGVQLQPDDLMTDFETGLIPAIQQEFPATRHKGCHFHHCQVKQLYSLMLLSFRNSFRHIVNLIVIIKRIISKLDVIV